MFLLDHNVQKRVATFLNGIGQTCKRTSEMGWEEKRNGDLLAVSADKGFTAILTNDQKFVKSAEASLKKHPSVCIIVLSLSQGPVSEYLPRFERAWRASPPKVAPGLVVYWP